MLNIANSMTEVKRFKKYRRILVKTCFSLFIFHFLLFAFKNDSAFGQTITGDTLSNSENITYNICDKLLEKTDFFVFSYDDWGFKGALSLLGLPASSIKVYYNNMLENDPLYGQVPLSWMNPGYFHLEIDKKSGKLNFSPFFSKDNKTVSGFHYYRGDYSFLNFRAKAAGNLSERIKWCFSGENFGYDGATALYGPDKYKLGESLSQSYHLDIRTDLNKWVLDVGTAYDKYMPGISNASLDLSGYPVWTFAGRNKEYRTNSYMKASSGSDKDSTIIGLQISSFLYRNTNNNDVFSLSGEASQFSGLLRKDFVFKKNSISIELLPLTHTVYFRNSIDKKQSLFVANLGSSRSCKFFDYILKVGIANKELIGFAGLRVPLLQKFSSDLSYQKNYALYPIIYEAPFGNPPSLFPGDNGFSYSIGSLGFNYDQKFVKSHSSFKKVRSDFFIPFRTTINDTLPIYRIENLDVIYFTENLKLQFPWNTTIQGRVIFTPSNNTDRCLRFQGWGRVLQKLGLFHNNLHLYAAGEVLFFNGGNYLAWFEELRNYGSTGTQYFTNERLNFTTRFGAHIGDFHIFYVIYNVEGRSFSTLALMPYRNRLKIFGIEWAFLN